MDILFSQDLMLLRACTGDEGPKEATNTGATASLLDKFSESKAGWRRTPTTARRQEKQLRSLLSDVGEACGERDASTILRLHLDDMENALLQKLPNHPAQVKSTVIALLEFSRFVSVREPDNNAAWDATLRRLEVWKRDATLRDHHRQADLQDRMGDEEYLPSKEELTLLRVKTLEVLENMQKTVISKRGDAVKLRRLLTTAILLDNFQRSGTITNATLAQYHDCQEGIIRVKEHKSRASYGSANLVITDVASYLDFYVAQARSFLTKDDHVDELFPSSDPWEDMGLVCAMFGVRKVSPTIIRKAASTAAYNDLPELERRQVANHMTHRPETAFKAYAAKNRRADAVRSVERMKRVMYSETSVSGAKDDERSTIPSSAGALERQSRARVPFSPRQEIVIEREARRIRDKNMFVTTSVVMALMARHKSLFEDRSPRCVENRLRTAVRGLRTFASR